MSRSLSGGIYRCCVGAISLTIFAVGCSRSPFTFVPASGKITYEDGTPLPTEGGLRVIFVSTAAPREDGTRAPQAAAFPDARGEFSRVSSTRSEGGMATGEYKVAIMYEGTDAKRFVPRDYISPKTTPLVVHTDNLPFDIKVPKSR
jgi:hypothetical protein